MAKALKHGGEGVLVEFNHFGAEGRPDSIGVPNDLKGVIQQFRGVFDTPKGLPLGRGREHAIVLREGTT